ncbi:DegT/DnrJ/EryC1/StrS aminotransferase family protein [Treponema pectinovorum]|uniref:DegT/DnrJ/EryC1/StrS family aminotransferase n=1 Tax=Treponema pectinovorum TaxID=164 RepID=UPI003D937EC0
MIQTFSSTIRRKEMDAVLTCLVDEKIGPGELNFRFMQSLKEYLGFSGAVAFRTPSIALSYALKALDLPKETPIMLSALAPFWQYAAVEEFGYKPLVLDVDEGTGVLNAKIVQEGIANGGRLLILHETMGILNEIEEIVALGIPVIEDISHSFGSTVFKDEELESETQKIQSKADKNMAGSFGIFAIMGLEEFDTVTGGGGAVLLSKEHKNWVVLKKYSDLAPRTDILPDINSALALVQLKEFSRNEEMRKNLFALFQRSLMSGKNRTFYRPANNPFTVWSFPVVLSGSFKDAKQYSAKKDIEIQLAYSDSIIAHLGEEEIQSLKVARSLNLRTVLFPLYPRLGSESAKKIAKVLGTLP